MTDYDISDLVDIRDVVIDRSLPKEERILDYITQIKNPYKYKDGKYTITVEYNETGESFKTHLERLIETIMNKGDTYG